MIKVAFSEESCFAVRISCKTTRGWCEKNDWFDQNTLHLRLSPNIKLYLYGLYYLCEEEPSLLGIKKFQNKLNILKHWSVILYFWRIIRMLSRIILYLKMKLWARSRNVCLKIHTRSGWKLYDLACTESWSQSDRVWKRVHKTRLQSRSYTWRIAINKFSVPRNM